MEETGQEEEILVSAPTKYELVFEGITVSIGDKIILQNVTGMAQSGRLLAIMGPSGAGKSTLLDTLAGRTTLTSGAITLNQQPVGKKDKRQICYVLQQDIFFPNLTLRETLKFAAMLRISDKVSFDDKMKQLDEVIEALGLKNCLDTMVGGDMMPGLSGGERKRANIACEILTDPNILLLDEPLTGLDASTAQSFVQLLKSYATSHDKIVITTVHQPSSRLFFSFDNLLLMCEGQNAYFGATNNVVEYFDAIGITIAEGFNPADFILEKIKNCSDTQQKILAAAIQVRSKEDWPLKDRSSSVVYDDPGSPTMLNPVQFKDKNPSFFVKFSKKKAKSDEEEPGSVHTSLMDLDEKSQQADISASTGKWPTGFLVQYKYLTVRAFHLAKSRYLDPTKLVENAVVCLLFTLIWFQLPRVEETVRDRMGAIFFIAIHWGFMPLFDAVASFPMERVVINKERAAGWYQLSAYYCAKMTSELPLTLLQPLLFVVVAYWAIGLNGITAFFATIGTVFINSIAGQSIGLFLGIVNTEMRQAITVTVLVQMIIMLLGGLFTRNLPFWLDWMKYLSFLFYSYNCLMYLEFKDGPPLVCSGQNGSGSAYPVCHVDNNTLIPSPQVLEHHQITWEFWQYLLPLFGYIVVFRSLGYIWLRFVQKPHQVS